MLRMADGRWWLACFRKWPMARLRCLSAPRLSLSAGLGVAAGAGLAGNGLAGGDGVDDGVGEGSGAGVFIMEVVLGWSLLRLAVRRPGATARAASIRRQATPIGAAGKWESGPFDHVPPMAVGGGLTSARVSLPCAYGKDTHHQQGTNHGSGRNSAQLENLRDPVGGVRRRHGARAAGSGCHGAVRRGALGPPVRSA